MFGLKKIFLSSPFLSILSGVFLGFSQPLYFSPSINTVHGTLNYLGLLSLFGLVPLFLVIRKASLLATFLYSFLTALIHFTISLYWIFIAVYIYGNVTPFTAAFLTLGLPITLGIYWATAFSFARFISNKLKFSFLIIAPIALCAVEYFRNYYIFGGFPWSNLGYSFARVDQFLQLASFVGIYGLVFFVAVINSVICFAIIQKELPKKSIALCVTLLALFFLLGEYKIRSFEVGKNTIDVAILQGNIEQDIKNKAYLHSDDILKIYQEMSHEAVLNKAKLIIWPESAYPRQLAENAMEFALSKELATSFIFGATSYGFNKDDENGYHYQNSAFAVDYQGQVVKRYDKSHLVPFGEYVPWPMKTIVSKVVPGIGAFKPGFNQTAFDLLLSPEKNIKVGINICYEGIFPEITRKYAQHNAKLIVNLTNDAWYGVSSAPYQHLLMYRLRAVETGISIIRATNSGVSAWIDPIGTIHNPSKLFSRKLSLEKIPLGTAKTFYTFFGDAIGQMCLFFLVGALLWIIFPFFHYLKNKKYISLAICSILVTVYFGYYLYISSRPYQLDESFDTKVFLLFCSTFLGIFLIGKFNKRL